MYDDGDAAPPRQPRRALTIWMICCAVLLAPSLFVWIVRGTAYAMQCAPGPASCKGIALGGGLRSALELAWALPMNSLLLLIVAFTAAIAAVIAGRALLGALT